MWIHAVKQYLEKWHHVSQKCVIFKIIKEQNEFTHQLVLWKMMSFIYKWRHFYIKYIEKSYEILYIRITLLIVDRINKVIMFSPWSILTQIHYVWQTYVIFDKHVSFSNILKIRFTHQLVLVLHKYVMFDKTV